MGDYSVIPRWVDALFLYSSVNQEYGLFKNLDPAHTRVDSTKSFESIKRLRKSNKESVCEEATEIKSDTNHKSSKLIPNPSS